MKMIVLNRLPPRILCPVSTLETFFYRQISIKFMRFSLGSHSVRDVTYSTAIHGTRANGQQKFLIMMLVHMPPTRTPIGMTVRE